MVPQKCGELKKPRVSEYCWQWHSHIKDPWEQQALPQIRLGMMQSLLPAQVLMFISSWLVFAKPSNCSFLLPDVYNLRPLAYRDLLLGWANCSPCAVGNKHTEVPGCWVVGALHQNAHNPPNPSFFFCLTCLCVCFFLIPSLPFSQVSKIKPWGMCPKRKDGGGGNQVKSSSQLSYFSPIYTQTHMT